MSESPVKVSVSSGWGGFWIGLALIIVCSSVVTRWDCQLGVTQACTAIEESRTQGDPL